VIVLTRLDGSRLAVNSDQIERLEEGTGATVITVMNGNSYIVAESLDAVVELITEFRTRISTQNARPVRRRTRGSAGRRHLALAGTDVDDDIQEGL
jgi:flagellar protein FlbD